MNGAGDGEAGRGAYRRGGDGEEVTNSAFPSRDNEIRTVVVGVNTQSSMRSGHEAGWLAVKLLIY